MHVLRLSRAVREKQRVKKKVLSDMESVSFTFSNASDNALGVPTVFASNVHARPCPCSRGAGSTWQNGPRPRIPHRSRRNARAKMISITQRGRWEYTTTGYFPTSQGCSDHPCSVQYSTFDQNAKVLELRPHPSQTFKNSIYAKLFRWVKTWMSQITPHEQRAIGNFLTFGNMSSLRSS